MLRDLRCNDLIHILQIVKDDDHDSIIPALSKVIASNEIWEGIEIDFFVSRKIGDPFHNN